MSIFLNSITGSRELEGSEIDKAIMAMAARLATLRKTLKCNADASIDLTLMLPGKTHKPDFSGMRMTGFSSVDGVLYIESAIPEQMLHSQQASDYVSALVQDALENATAFFTEQGLEFSAQQWQAALEESV